MLSTEAILYYKDRPVEFVKDIIKATPDDIQGEILESVAQNQLTSVRSGHGIGTSALESWLIFWFMCTRPFPKIPCTAPTKHQLHDILWAEVANPENWFAVPRTATQPDALQGFHAEHLLYIIDEASRSKRCCI